MFKKIITVFMLTHVTSVYANIDASWNADWVHNTYVHPNDYVRTGGYCTLQSMDIVRPTVQVIDNAYFYHTTRTVNPAWNHEGGGSAFDQQHASQMLLLNGTGEHALQNNQMGNYMMTLRDLTFAPNGISQGRAYALLCSPMHEEVQGYVGGCPEDAVVAVADGWGMRRGKYQCTKSIENGIIFGKWEYKGDIDNVYSPLSNDDNLPKYLKDFSTNADRKNAFLYKYIVDSEQNIQNVQEVAWCNENAGEKPLVTENATICTNATTACKLSGDANIEPLRPINMTFLEKCFGLRSVYELDTDIAATNTWPLYPDAMCRYTCTETGWKKTLADGVACEAGFEPNVTKNDCVASMNTPTQCQNSGGRWDKPNDDAQYPECICDETKNLEQSSDRITCRCAETYRTIQNDDGTFDRCQSTNNTDIKAACVELGNDVAYWDTDKQECKCVNSTKLFEYKNRHAKCDNVNPEYEACEQAQNETFWDQENQECFCLDSKSVWDGEKCSRDLALRQFLCNASGGEWAERRNGNKYCNCNTGWWIDEFKVRTIKYNSTRYKYCDCMAGSDVHINNNDSHACKPTSDVTNSDTIFDAAEWLSDHSGILTSNATDDADGTPDTISELAKTLDAIENAYGLSKWRTVDGKFNYARLASDATAAVVLGTTGALVTSSVVKKKQVEAGFESLECTVGGQHVGDWGDVFRINGK